MKSRNVTAWIVVLSVAASLLAAQEAYAQEEKPLERPRRQRVITDLSGFELVDTTKVNTQTIVVGATRGSDDPIPMAPRLGMAYGATPLLTWGFWRGAGGFVVTIWNEVEEQVHRTEVSHNSFRYPPDAPALEPGRFYYWTVSASMALMAGGTSAPVGVLMVPSPQRDRIQVELDRLEGLDPYAAGLARARIFTRHRVWYDAIAEYTDLIEAYPDRAELHEERGMIYAQLEVTQALADADFARADELAGS